MFRIPFDSRVFITYPPSASSSISPNVVVCIPVLWASEISDVQSWFRGKNRLIRYSCLYSLLPLVTLFCLSAGVSVHQIPSPVVADTATTLITDLYRDCYHSLIMQFLFRINILLLKTDNHRYTICLCRSKGSGR